MLGSSGLNELLGSTLGDKNQILIGIEEFKSKEFQHKFLTDTKLLMISLVLKEYQTISLYMMKVFTQFLKSNGIESLI